MLILEVLTRDVPSFNFKWSFQHNSPQPWIDRVDEEFHSIFPIAVVHPFKLRRFVLRKSVCEKCCTAFSIHLSVKQIKEITKYLDFDLIDQHSNSHEIDTEDRLIWRCLHRALIPLVEF
ncbi:hypothetical protein LINPERPRIM_LOCUS20701 [Linum perenne]